MLRTAKMMNKQKAVSGHVLIVVEQNVFCTAFQWLAGLLGLSSLAVSVELQNWCGCCLCYIMMLTSVWGF